MIPPEGYELVTRGHVLLGDKVWATEPLPHWKDVDEDTHNDLIFIDATDVEELHAVARRIPELTYHI